MGPKADKLFNILHAYDSSCSYAETGAYLLRVAVNSWWGCFMDAVAILLSGKKKPLHQLRYSKRRIAKHGHG